MSDVTHISPGLKQYLAGFIARMPIEDIGDEFQRGFLGGLISAYEAAGFDRGDARYQAGLRLAKRMSKEPARILIRE